MEVCEYTRHASRAKTSMTCANYALYQVPKNSALNDKNLVKMVQRNFSIDEILKSVRTTQEAIQLYLKDSKGGIKLTKFITSDNEIKSQIPKTFGKLSMLIHNHLRHLE